MPVDLLRAISHANRLIYWQENLDEDEFPPDWMCPFDDLLVDHFDWVMKRRKEKYSGNSSDDDEGGNMVSNEYSVGRGSNVR